MMDLRAAFNAGVTAVRGDTSVAHSLRSDPIPAPDRIIAVGKAATAMARAAHEAFPQAPVLIVTKYGHSDGAPTTAEIIEAAHPVLDENSLIAGARVLQVVRDMPPGSHLLMLVSGGASALAEAPVDGMDLAAFQARTSEMLSSGADIHAMNAARKTLSQIKGGKLLSRFPGARVTTLAISDVEGDSLGVIGSGLGDAPETPAFVFAPRIVASNAVARGAVERFAGAVRINAETLYDDITTLAPRIVAQLMEPGIYVFGGEPTVVLPENPGQGGRNQALALLLAREIAGRDGIRILVAGTDGTDGPTHAAGGIVDGRTWTPSAAGALARADALPYLEAHDALLTTGPTGTNVMDLVIAEVSTGA